MNDKTLPILGLILEVREQVFRVARMAPDKYSVVRVSDNTRLGSFARVDGAVQLSAGPADMALLAEVVATALRRGL